MKRLFLFFLLIGTVLSANAIDFDQLVKLGLPADAKPAKFYFKCYFFNQNEKPSQFDYEDSSLESGDDKFYFFVKPTPRGLHAYQSLGLRHTEECRKGSVQSKRRRKCQALCVWYRLDTRQTKYFQEAHHRGDEAGCGDAGIHVQTCGGDEVGNLDWF